ncbi:SUMF1/EgtB/PvdO family nonheme iron enzyme [Candidatus Electronema sp. PJ]|uniref:SUMF1/EgtB/PvdO family nonheme iron enzyme n=1 Tax=Candidatus Electronema sp. PJ TaxID=3401572 RepID=UPI003AA8900F
MAWQQKRKQLGIIGLLLLFLVLAVSAAASEQLAPLDFGRYYALVIGNQSYKNLEELWTARADAQEVARMLEEQYGFKVELLLDADRDRTLWTLSQLPKRMAGRERDSLLIYYAGHGQLGRGGSGYWKPIDATQDSEAGWIPTKLITNILSTVRVRHVLVVTDSAYSDAFQLPDDARLRESKEARLRRLLETPSITVLTSGSDKPVHEAEAKYSLFARSFLITLRDNREILSGRSLFGRMLKPVYRSTGEMPRYGYASRNHQEQGDFFLVPKQLQEALRQREMTQPAPRVIMPTPEPPPMVAATPAPEPRQANKGDVLINAASGMEFVYVPGGCFKMGSEIGEKSRFAWEGPVHEVCVNGFWMGKYEVTQEQWQKIMGDNPAGFNKGGQYPVENVSWEDIKEFITRLNKRSGKMYRLPTEAEWEYACRANGSGKYCGGDNPDVLAWHEENSGKKTHPVGGKQANGFGLYDMSGNVWEWCNDKFDKDYYAAGGVRNNPQGPSGGGERVERGGSAASRVHNCRAAFRFRNRPDYHEDMLGFRILMQE